MVNSDAICLSRIYCCLKQIEAVLGADVVSVTLAGNGCGYLYHEEEGRWLSWNTLAEGRKCMQQLANWLSRGLTYEQYIDRLGLEAIE